MSIHRRACALQGSMHAWPRTCTHRAHTRTHVKHTPSAHVKIHASCLECAITPKRTCTYERSHACARTHARTHVHAHTRVHTHARAHACVRTLTRTHTRTDVHAHARMGAHAHESHARTHRTHASHARMCTHARCRPPTGCTARHGTARHGTAGTLCCCTCGSSTSSRTTSLRMASTTGPVRPAASECAA